MLNYQRVKPPEIVGLWMLYMGLSEKKGRPLQVFSSGSPLKLPQTSTNQILRQPGWCCVVRRWCFWIDTYYILLYLHDIDALPIQQLVCVTGPDRTPCFLNCSNKIWIILVQYYIFYSIILITNTVSITIDYYTIILIAEPYMIITMIIYYTNNHL